MDKEIIKIKQYVVLPKLWANWCYKTYNINILKDSIEYIFQTGNEEQV